MQHLAAGAVAARCRWRHPMLQALLVCFWLLAHSLCCTDISCNSLLVNILLVNVGPQHRRNAVKANTYVRWTLSMHLSKVCICSASSVMRHIADTLCCAAYCRHHLHVILRVSSSPAAATSCTQVLLILPCHRSSLVIRSSIAATDQVRAEPDTCVQQHYATESFTPANTQHLLCRWFECPFKQATNCRSTGSGVQL